MTYENIREVILKRHFLKLLSYGHSCCAVNQEEEYQFV